MGPQRGPGGKSLPSPAHGLEPAAHKLRPLLMGVQLMGVYLTGVHLMGVYLISVRL